MILQNGDNKYKKGPFEDGEVAGETGEWLDLDTFLPADLGQESTENAI